MSFLLFIKKRLTTLPYGVGRLVSHVPYSMRPGLSTIYRQRKAEIDALRHGDGALHQSFIFEHVKQLAVYAYENVPFYKDLYSSLSVDPVKFSSFADLNELPIITKKDLQTVPLEYRSVIGRTRELVNTGGSSGNPLEFYIEPSSIPHEWAHMHEVWSKVDFKQSDLKLVFGGRSNVVDIVQYDSARHQLNVDIYSGWPAVADKLFAIFQRYRPTYMHGYPSSIFDFVLWLDEHQHPLLPLLRDSIKGLLLGSEMPALELRKHVESILNCTSVSWYGHTERAVLAYEKTDYGIYTPFTSYGYAEAVAQGDGTHLVGTAYHNYVSPLIRYDTGDLITPVVSEGVLRQFSITHGREGEFILDRHGNKIFLTGLIFGRHHALFEQARYIQIRQYEQGQAEVLVVPRRELTSEQASAMFDTSNVAMEFSFKITDEPVRTRAGKVPLLVRG